MNKSMKKIICVCLLTLSAAAGAQAPPDPKLAGDEAKTRAELDAARERLDQAAREVAELSMRLGGGPERHAVFIERGGPRRAMLGVQIDSDKEGARVIGVSPGGPAEEAGIKDGDVIIALDGKKIGGDNAGRVVVDEMRGVKPDQKVKVVVLRNGKKHDYLVVARPLAFAGDRVFSMRGGPEHGGVMSGGLGPMPFIQQFRGFWQGRFEGLELASLTPKLGAYFGTSTGVLVVQAPAQAALKLEEGDVIQSIDGRKTDDGAHALRILSSYKPGEKLNLAVLRQRKPLTLAVTMPDPPVPPEGSMDHFEMAIPPMPPTAPVAPVPAVPGGPGADT